MEISSRCQHLFSGNSHREFEKIIIIIRWNVIPLICMATVITAALQLYDFSLKTAGTLGNWEEQRLFDTPRAPCSCHGSSNSWHLAKSYSSTPNRVFLNPQS